MSAAVIDGKKVAAEIVARVGGQVAALGTRHGFTPGLDVVLVGENPASQVYVRSKERAANAAGMAGRLHRLPETTTQEMLIALLMRLNADPAVNGILVQLPLPKGIDAQAVIQAIDPAKDVDGFHAVNTGRLWSGGESLVPCTPQGCMILIRRALDNVAGAHAVVAGRSNIVGKPVAALLLAADCTVTVAHSKTRDLPRVCRGADILVAAVGRAQMVRGDWIKPGAVVIDVGINRLADGKLVGDVAYGEAIEVAGAITPVPGGVGPMTIACLLANTVIAACRQRGVAIP